MDFLRWDPLSDLRQIRQRIDHLLEGELNLPGRLLETVSPTWAPLVDIYETDEAIVVEAEIAGMKKAEIAIELSGDTLTIKGERQPRLEQAARDDAYANLLLPQRIREAQLTPADAGFATGFTTRIGNLNAKDLSRPTALPRLQPFQQHESVRQLEFQRSGAVNALASGWGRTFAFTPAVNVLMEVVNGSYCLA